MRLRLLKYCCRIWEQAEQEEGRLRAIVPVVLYQGASGGRGPPSCPSCMRR
ncbi:MAG: Rpn family recombination-promoting nuclease/putative transposase [Spirochaetaceae bacterium]|nr:Rpn family recombination-promoting nuclease/putative transposase [Spirochaetaceae bacterium]